MNHGGNIEAIKEKYNLFNLNITDFSANTNPVGAPKIKINREMLETYPEPEYKNLRRAIADYINCDYKKITVGNGSSELISLLFKVISPLQTLVVAPTYSEYEREANLIQSEILYYVTRPENSFNIKTNDLFKLITDKTQLLVICNPNNPTGVYTSNDTLKDIIDYCLKKNIFVIIDESYAEFFDKSAIGLINKYKNLIIIRGTSKFFCLPGLRLGYAIMSDCDLLDKINKLKNPWSVNSIANYVGQVIFKDTEYISRSKSYVKKECMFIKKAFKKINLCKLYDSQTNFFLCEILDHKTATDLFFYLLKNGLVIRDLSNLKFLGNKFFRFAVNTHKNNIFLIGCLKKFFA